MASKKDETSADSKNMQEQGENSPIVDPAEEAKKIIEEAKAAAKEIIGAARSEVDKIIAEAKEKAEQEAQDMAQAKKAAPANGNKKGDELVSIQLFKDNDRYKDDVFVAVNGERVQIKRGERVQIKRKFADVLEQSMRQDTATANMIERQSAEFEEKAASLNI